MATEKRLIDAAPLMKNGWHLVKTGKSNVYLGSMSLADVPTVDAVEVVYCQDCAKCIKGFCTIRKDSWGATLKVGLHDFCSDGERKEDAR